MTGIVYTRVEIFQHIVGMRIGSSELSVSSTKPNNRPNKKFRVLLQPSERTIFVYGETESMVKVGGMRLERMIPKFISDSDVAISASGIYENGYPQSHFSPLAHKFKLPDGCSIHLSYIMVNDKSSVTVLSPTVIRPSRPDDELAINLSGESRFYASLSSNCRVRLGVFGKSRARFSDKIPFQTEQSGVVSAGTFSSVVRSLKLYMHDEGKVSDIGVEELIELNVFSPNCECDVYAFDECVNISEYYRGMAGTTMPTACRIRTSNSEPSSPMSDGSSSLFHLPNHGNNQRLLGDLTTAADLSVRNRSWISRLARQNTEDFDPSETALAIRRSEELAASSGPSFVFEDQNSFSTFKTEEKPKFPVIAPKGDEDALCSICYDARSTYTSSCEHRVCCADCLPAFQRGVENCPYCKKKITFVFRNASEPTVPASSQ